MAEQIDFGGLNFDFGRRRSLFHQLRRDRTHSPNPTRSKHFFIFL
ncbi:hypothetical protein QUA20_13030 [Microcoleus sp. Pol7_A1]